MTINPGLMTADTNQANSPSGPSLIRRFLIVLLAATMLAVGLGISPAAAEYPVPPDPVTNIQFYGNGDRVEVSWHLPNFWGDPYYTSINVSVRNTADNSFVDSCTAGFGDTYCFMPRAPFVGGLGYYIYIYTSNGNWGVSPTVGLPAPSPGPSSVPRNLVATPGNGSVTLTWDAPTYSGNSSPYTYRPESDTGQACSTNNSTTCTVTGLTNGTSYKFKINDYNGQYYSSYSAWSSAVTPVGPPDAPTGVNVSAGNAEVLVSWTATPPANNGGSAITGYSVQAYLSNGTAVPGATCTPTPATDTTCTVNTGLTNGIDYTFKAAAINAIDTGAESTASGSVTPIGPPAAPTDVSGEFGDSQVTVSWAAGSDGGSAITGYDVKTYDSTGANTVSGAICSSTTGSPVATTCDVTGLTNGTGYTFAVTATSNMGTGAESLVSGVITPAAVPDAPTTVTGVFGDSQVTVSWVAGAANGSAIIGYDVKTYLSDGITLVDAKTCSSTTGSPVATTCDVTGLANGTTYTFKVSATNDAGTGSASAASAGVTPAAVPDAPTTVTGVFGDSQVSVSWVAGAANGSAITGYDVKTYDSTGANTVSGAICSSTTGSPVATTCDVTGLANGTTYTFKVSATNDVGTGAESLVSGVITPAAVPDAPTTVTGVFGDSQVSVSWVAGAANGSAITGYDVKTYLSDGITLVDAKTCSSTTGSPVATTCDVTGLANGTTYTFKVSATNDAGTGSASAASAGVTPAAVPDAPTTVTGVFGDSQVTVSWVAGAANGSAITGYDVKTYLSDGITLVDAKTCSSTTGSPVATTCDVTGLANGTTYTFKVSATNDAGTGSASAASAGVTPAAVPDAPTTVTGVFGDSQVTVSWVAGAANGSAITGYDVKTYLSDGITLVDAKTCSSTTGSPVATTCDVTGLANGTTYTFKVSATNDAGTGSASAASAGVTPAAVPDAPTTVTGVFGDSQVTVSWVAGAANGSAITGYDVKTYLSDGITLVDAKTCSSTTGSPVATTCDVTGLANGTTYTFKVSATNDAGTGSASAASAGVTPAAVPDAPTTVTGVFGDSQVTVSWVAGAANGSAITGYDVKTYLSDGITLVDAKTCSSTTGSPVATTCDVTGLTNGTSYRFKVTATNDVGTGAESLASAAVTPAKAPGVPTGVSGAFGNTQVVVSWTPGSDGGSAITGYSVQAYDSTGTNAVPDKTCTTTGDTTCTVTGLANGTTYRFKVSATNAITTGVESAASAGVTPAAVPAAPTGVAGTPGDSSVVLHWIAPANNGAAISGYTATATPGGATCSNSATSCTVTGLDNGTDYTFKVTATNIAGTSAVSAASAAVTPAAVPAAPTGVAGTPGDSSVVLHWTAPAANGAAISGYTATATPGGATCSNSATSCTVTGLDNGTEYTFKVTATNSAGTGVESAASAGVTPAKAPGAPTGVTGVFGDNKAVVSWNPATPNGAPVGAYAVTTYQPDGTTSVPGKTCTTTGATTCPVTGLTNGTAYTFKVSATNSAGTGAESVASSAVTPAAVPDAPSGVSGLRGDRSALVSWTAPAANGAVITGYTVTASSDGAMCSTSQTSCTVSGLTNGSVYTFTVTATNAAGTSVASSPTGSVAPATVPNAPINLVPVSGNSQVTLSWDVPSNSPGSLMDGGSPITSYSVQAYEANGAPEVNGVTCSPTSLTDLTCTVDNLINGTVYTFMATATNLIGHSANSVLSARVTPSAVPAAPTGVAGTPGDSSVVVTWAAPATNGAAITSYTVTASPGGATCSNSATSCTVTGLANGTDYTFTVTATNLNGPSIGSDPSAPITPAIAPDAPTSVSGTFGDTEVTVSWAAPGDNGGVAITGYTVTAAPDGATCSPTLVSTTHCTVPGLVNGTPYTFTVTATSDAGTSAASVASGVVTPAKAPEAPTTVSGTPGNTEVTVTWSAGAANGAAITAYTVATYESNGATAVADKTCATTGARTCTVTGLANGHVYTFKVTATNVAGTGSPSNASGSVTPAAVPDAPTVDTATFGDTEVTVSWTPGADGGSAISAYTVTATPGGATCSPILVSTTNCTVPGLANGTPYTFTVTATNDAGTSAASVASGVVTPAKAPEAPTGVTGTPSDGRVLVNWSAGAANGAAITAYNVQAYESDGTTSAGSGKTCATTGATTCTVTGLANGHDYTFKVIATNVAGTGSASVVSDAVTPAKVPDAPTSVTATLGDSEATVVWAAPGSDGGATISAYTVTADPGGATCSPTLVSDYTCTVTGLANGTPYTFTVAATNNVGTSANSARSAAVTPVGPPEAPISVTAQSGDAEVVVSWTAPDNNGGDVISAYNVATYESDGTTAVADKTCATTGATTCTITGLANGTVYTFKATATNTYGTGSESDASNPATPVNPITAPSVPTGIAGTAGDTQVTLTWAAPGYNGGAAGTVYIVTADPGGATCATTGATTCTITGLTNGTPYTFTAVASNGAGNSANSAPSAAVTPHSQAPGLQGCPSGSSPFADTASSFAAADIGCISALGITNGTTATTFTPKAKVTREQMAAMLARAWRSFGRSCPTTPSPFADTSTSFAAADIGCIAALGITTGTTATTFSPSDPITREQMAAFLGRMWRALGLTQPDTAMPFTDATRSFATHDIAWMYKTGITTGTTATTFSPSAVLTREQAVAFFARTIRCLAL